MFTNKMSLSDMPQALAYLISKVERIGTLPEAKMPGSPVPDKWLNLYDLCSYLPDKPVAQTIYGRKSRKQIPSRKKSKKHLFLQREIDARLKTGKEETACQTGEKVNECITNYGRAKQ